MATFLTVMSFPFWFFGIIFFVASITGKVKVNDAPASTAEHVTTFFVSLILLAIAYSMTF